MATDIVKKSESKKVISDMQKMSIAIFCFVSGLIIFTLSYVGMNQQMGLGKLNQPILSWMINHRSVIVTPTAQIVTSIANPYIFASIVGVLVVAWIIIKKEFWRPLLLVIAIAFAAVISTVLKTIFMDSRPPQIDMIPMFEYDFSFPSGHTIGMAVFLLVIGYLIYSRNYSLGRFLSWITVAIIGTCLIALSRLYLGYHWLTDVVASVGLALIILAIVIIVDSIFVKSVKPK
jgi:membrane-associated phospholipid phosphatase